VPQAQAPSHKIEQKYNTPSLAVDFIRFFFSQKSLTELEIVNKILII
jgi:hypothetical protein